MEEALKNKPKKPLNFYMIYRMKKMEELKGTSDWKNTLKKGWDAISEDEKEKEKVKYHKELEKYTEAFEKWKKKYNIENDEEKGKKSKSPAKREMTKGKAEKHSKDEETKDEKPKKDEKKVDKPKKK